MEGRGIVRVRRQADRVWSAVVYPGRRVGHLLRIPVMGHQRHMRRRPVKGAMALDQMYMAEGGAIHFKKDLIVNNNMHVIWWTFVTMYKDGTWDAGSFMVGHENLGYAILMNEKGEIRTTTDIEGTAVHKNGSYFLESARIVLEGEEEWEF